MYKNNFQILCVLFCCLILQACANTGSPYGSNKDATTDLGLGSSEVMAPNWKIKMKKLIFIALIALSLAACANVGGGSSTIGSNSDAINSPTANPRAASN